MPGLGLPAAQPQTELITQRTVPFVSFTTRSTSSGVFNSSNPTEVNSSRIGWTASGGYMDGIMSDLLFLCGHRVLFSLNRRAQPVPGQRGVFHADREFPHSREGLEFPKVAAAPLPRHHFVESDRNLESTGGVGGREKPTRQEVRNPRQGRFARKTRPHPAHDGRPYQWRDGKSIGSCASGRAGLPARGAF